VSQEFSMGEIIGAGVWTASAISVVGYTWSALTGEYEKFPGINSGPGVPPPKAAVKSSTAIGLPKLTQGKTGVATVAGVAASPITPDTVGTGNIVRKVAGWIVNIFP